jgi:hypothetical protein
MENVFILLSFCLLTGSFCSVYGQEGIGKYQQHTGFFLSRSTGPVFGKITSDAVSPDFTGIMEFSGNGIIFDIKIGGALNENLVLHATMISSMINGPKVKSGYQTGKAPENMGITENMLIGGGLTYYIMPENFFLSGSVGIGNYSGTDSKDSSNNFTSDNGFSMQLKAGKEWWVGKRWGLGMAVTYGKTFTNTQVSAGKEKLNSNRFGVVFNATFN